jgi:PilZ domain
MASAARTIGKVIQFHGSHDATTAGTEANRRGGSRRRVLKAGIVAYNARFCTLPCMVRDISTLGARVRIDGSVNAPDTFELIIDSEGLEASCEVVWRKEHEVGVKFLGAPRIVVPKRTQAITAVSSAQRPSIRRKQK